MLTVEKSPCIVLQYNWKLPNFRRDVVFLSNKIKYQKLDSFIVGFKDMSPYSSPTLLFVTTNLNKIGLKATGATFSQGSDCKKTEMILKTNDVNDQNGEVQLFTAAVEGDTFYTNRPIMPCSFIFTIFLNGINENYRVYQMDGLISHQLWSSETNQDGTNFNLIAKDGRNFPVHRWILAARSNFFEAMFSDDQKSVGSTTYRMNSTSDEVEQFIKFLYMGEFEVPLSSSKLLQLAVKYKVENLEKLLLAATQSISADKMSIIALHLGPGSHIRQCQLEITTPGPDFCEINHKGNVSILKCSWKVNLWTNSNPGRKIEKSEAFQYQGKKLFRAESEYWTADYRYYFTLKFLSYGHTMINCNIEEVICSLSNNLIRMTEKQTLNTKSLQVFTIPESELISRLSTPFVITFSVKLRSTVDHFINKMLDSTWSEQLWAAAVDKKMTDVEFLVGEESFGAHRSLLSARSPVFAAMFSSGMKEVETGRVRIEDIDSDIFQHFLKFLYNGIFDSSSMDEELFAVADKYQVETLMELCRPATQAIQMDMGNNIETFLSC